jgi:hypothetical protein
MATRIEIIPHFKVSTPVEEKNFFPLTKFYCKEEPKAVLEVLAKNFFIGTFNSLYLPERNIVTYKEFRFMYDLSIQKVNIPEGLRVSSTLADFDLSFLKANPPKYFDNEFYMKDRLLEDLIKRHLVFVYSNEDDINSLPKVETVFNYLTERHERKQAKMEMVIQDIIDLTSVFKKEDITISDLENTKLHLPKIGDEYIHFPGLN